jgi:DnaJ-class molecular chaperone
VTDSGAKSVSLSVGPATEPPPPLDLSDSGSSSGSSNSDDGTKCAVCNGTGYVRYYYGDSDWEAVLSGHDPYTTGPCTSCGGTGRVN